MRHPPHFIPIAQARISLLITRRWNNETIWWQLRVIIFNELFMSLICVSYLFHLPLLIPLTDYRQTFLLPIKIVCLPTLPLTKLRSPLTSPFLRLFIVMFDFLAMWESLVRFFCNFAVFDCRFCWILKYLNQIIILVFLSILITFTYCLDDVVYFLDDWVFVTWNSRRFHVAFVLI